MNGIDFIVNHTNALSSGKVKMVTKEEYSQFLEKWVFEALAEKRFGQAFCDYFGVDHYSPIYYFKDNTIAEQWITRFYVK